MSLPTPCSVVVTVSKRAMTRVWLFAPQEDVDAVTVGHFFAGVRGASAVGRCQGCGCLAAALLSAFMRATSDESAACFCWIAWLALLMKTRAELAGEARGWLRNEGSAPRRVPASACPSLLCAASS